MPLPRDTQRSKKELRLVRRRTSARAGTHVAAGRFSHNKSAKILMEFHFLAASIPTAEPSLTALRANHTLYRHD